MRTHTIDHPVYNIVSGTIAQPVMWNVADQIMQVRDAAGRLRTWALKNVEDMPAFLWSRS